MGNPMKILPALALLAFTLLGFVKVSADPATATPASAPGTPQERWMQAVGARLYAKQPDVFTFVESDPKLPDVLIIGDSISMGYTPVVRKALAEKANVFRIPANGGDTNNILLSLDKWFDAIGRPHFKAIVFNSGLHDVARRAKGKPDTTVPVAVPIADYQANLEKIVARLHDHASALLWAATTVVPSGDAVRRAGDEVRYNEAAAVVMNRHRIPIIDLYTLSNIDRARYELKPENVHYNAAGYERLGAEVANQISRHLK